MKDKTILFILFVVIAAVLVSLPLFINGRHNNRLNIKGSTTVYPIILHCVDDFKKNYPKAKIKIDEIGSGGGIAALIDGTADIAMSSRPLTEKEEKTIAEKGMEIDEIVIARDGIAIIVNPQNPAEMVTRSQLRDLYQGRISGWKELGGEAGQIVCVSRDVSSGTFLIFSKMILGEKKLRSDIQLVPSNRVMVQSVAENRDAIGYVGLGYIDRTVKAIPIDGVFPDQETVKNGRYPLSRTLFLFSKKKVSKIEEKFLEFVLSPKGQDIVREKGFVPAK